MKKEENKTRKQRSDKGKKRNCGNCSGFYPYPDEYVFFYGGDCIRNGENTSTENWCKHWKKL